MDNQLLEHLLSFLTERRKNLFEEVISKRTRHFTIATEDVYQLHNTSAVMRSCDVFGIQDLHVIEEKVSKKIDREIAMGAQKWVNIHRHPSTNECIDILKKEGYQIIATSPHNNSTELSEFDIMYSKGISKMGEIIDLGVEHGIIDKSGSWFSYGETKLGQGRDSVKAILTDNPDLCDELEEKIVEALKV